MIQLIVLVILTLFTSFVVDFQTACLVIVSFLVGELISYCVGGHSRQKVTKIYGITFSVGWFFMLVCYQYMIHHGFSWLFAFDTYNYFLPTTEYLIRKGGGNLWRVYQIIYEDYNFFAGEECIYWVYTCTWGVLINEIGGTLYFGLQTATLFLYGFVGVVLEKILRVYGCDEGKSYRHAIVICLVSIIFFYSSQVLRDIHVLLFYLIAIYLSSQPKFSIKILAALFIVIYLTCEIRIESGLFLFLVIPTYLLLSIQNRKYSLYAVFVSVVLLLIFLVRFRNTLGSVLSIFNTTAEYYSEGIVEGTGVIAFFQRIPVIGDLLSIIYNASQPIPVWIRLDPLRNLQYGGNASNILNFPKIYSAFFNVMTYVYVFIWLINKKVREKVHITKAHKYQLWIGFLFLFIQSAVIEQRRLMGYYCVFYILMFLIHDSLNNNEKNTVNIVTIGVFALLQIVGLVLFI